MSDAIETYESEETGIKAIVAYDDSAGSFNPRTDFDNAWTLIGFQNGRRRFGDEEVDLDNLIEMEGDDEGFDLGEWLKDNHDAFLIVKVEIYEHSLVSYTRMKGVSLLDEWDSGIAGVAILTRAKLNEEWEGDEEKALEVLDGELEVFTDWANGHVYGYYTVDAEGNRLDDDCWGMYGFDYVCEEAKRALKEAVQSWLDEQTEARYWAEREVETT